MNFVLINKQNNACVQKFYNFDKLPDLHKQRSKQSHVNDSIFKVKNY